MSYPEDVLQRVTIGGRQMEIVSVPDLLARVPIPGVQTVDRVYEEVYEMENLLADYHGLPRPWEVRYWNVYGSSGLGRVKAWHPRS